MYILHLALINGIGAYTFLNVCGKFTSFCQFIEKEAHKSVLFSASYIVHHQ